MRWIDTHCHLDAPEFSGDVQAVRTRARESGVVHCVLPAVERSNWEAVRVLAHACGDSYALGIHPLYVPRATPDDLLALRKQLEQHRDDPRLVAVGEIGLDFFEPTLCTDAMRVWQEQVFLQQLELARALDLPIFVHVRRSVDRVLKYLRQVRPKGGWRGIAHAFNGSDAQAQRCIDLGLKLGFGGALTFERALQLRRLASTLPNDAWVLETDAPDIPPHWLYVDAQQRALGQPQGRNEPGELGRIAQCMAALRGLPLEAVAQTNADNACAALPRLLALLDSRAA
ncbi:TatD family hydrolase [Curvibacter sp. APW13]|uniref:TatD family hydrolase n=1 Tax=Curvibacter sp. APW13 TaxID=3077236 RepID=UPI0028DED47B|nr:TatD family hydrolase [Curvibacter sp. APW13]MDT8991912.1 TatD family hydrolase [Curvibacter sp. APW13]